MLKEKIFDIIKYTKNLNVLYIEDNREVQEQTHKMLSPLFNNVTKTNNGKEAIIFFDKQKFDLIITDIQMPEIDGLTFIDYVRKKDKQIPILVLSAHENTKYFLRTINSGIDGYLLKPYNLEEIIKALINIMDKHNLKKSYSIVYLENNFYWNRLTSKLYKNTNNIKLTKNESKLFELYIDTNSSTKTYDEIEYYIFDSCNKNTKKLRNLISRLKSKLNYELFETIYSYGYTIKYKEK